MGKKTLAILSMSILTFLCASQGFSQNESTLFPGIVRIESGLSIGGVDDYFTFPGARGAANTVLTATDGAGTTAWQLIQDKNLQGIGEAAGTSGQVLGSIGTGGFVWVAQGTEGILRLTLVVYRRQRDADFDGCGERDRPFGSLRLRCEQSDQSQRRIQKRDQPGSGSIASRTLRPWGKIIW